MPFDASGFEQLKLMLNRLPTAVGEEAMREVQRLGVDLRDLARKMAPIDYGDLRGAIKMRSVGNLRGAGGRWAKFGATVEVYIDNEHPLTEGKRTRKNGEEDDATVGSYAWWVHEHMQPYGHMNLGPKSLAAQASDPSVMVGGKFMERAADEIAAIAVGRIAGVVRKHVESLDME